MKVLIIDDSRFSRSLTVKWFRAIRPEAVIIEAEGGQNGIDLFDREVPDMLVTDLVMPEITGDQVIRRIRATGKPCFVVALTANVQKKVQQEIRDLGADLFLEKPVSEEKVQRLIDAYEQNVGQ
jgi:two-component system, chemotaxis family, chemotaxis protein CheY